MDGAEAVMLLNLQDGQKDQSWMDKGRAGQISGVRYFIETAEKPL